jgi:hypothetical protein
MAHRYAAFEFGDRAAANVVKAIHFLEQDYPMSQSSGPCYHIPCGSSSDDVCASALTLIEDAAAVMTPESRAAWRWRILHNRAIIDDALHKTGGQVRSHALFVIMFVWHAQVSDLHPLVPFIYSACDIFTLIFNVHTMRYVLSCEMLARFLQNGDE